MTHVTQAATTEGGNRALRFLGMDVGTIPIAPPSGHRPQFRAPLYLAWETTLRCNARCVHCYSASGPEVSSPEVLQFHPRATVLLDQPAASQLRLGEYYREAWEGKPAR